MVYGRCLIPLSLVLCVGCGASLEELRGYNAAAQVVLATHIISHARSIKTLTPPEAETNLEDPVHKLAKAIEVSATDCRDRAFLAQLDHNHLPEETPVIGAEEDTLKKVAYAGKAYERNRSREWWSGWWERMAKGAGDFVVNVAKSFIPTWFLAGVGVLLLLALALYLRGWLLKRDRNEARDAAYQMIQLAEKYMDKDKLSETKGRPAQKLFHEARDKGLLE